MSEDLSLFGDEPAPSPQSTGESEPERLPDWQVNALRTALDRTTTADMAQRQRLVEDVVGRPVSSLRELTHAEAGRLRDELHRRLAEESVEPTGKSAWDDRDEATWIDRL